MTGRLVGFTGAAGAGKSTAADALIEDGWARSKFADPLKNMLRSFYKSCGIEDGDYIEARIEGSMKEEPCPFLRGRTPRHAMQTLGTDWGRECIHDSIWVEAWRQRTIGLLNQGVDVVVDDCRFPNEAEAIRKLGGHVVEILGRSGGIGKTHKSEQGAGEADMTITNKGSLEQFKNDIVYVFARMDFPEPEPDERA